ncbi:hypothetical protein AGMMS50268_36770 [Spirochaetia bacterium]|nr:hypothetical protein AGMMS50268_36770 [Spirochaetia bacterium]
MGAVLAKLLAAMSCKVIINFQYSLEDASHLKNEIISEGGSVELWQGDIFDLNWLNTKKEELIAKGQSLDILILNACQPPHALLFNASTISRINTYISRNFELTSVPLALFSPMINEYRGYEVIISSEYVIHPKREFTQYVILKTAIESLVSSMAYKYDHIKWRVVRPPKMLTDMSNSPMGNHDASDPVLIAKNICEHIFINNIDRNSNFEIFSPQLQSRL